MPITVARYAALQTLSHKGSIFHITVTVLLFFDNRLPPHTGNVTQRIKFRDVRALLASSKSRVFS